VLEQAESNTTAAATTTATYRCLSFTPLSKLSAWLLRRALPVPSRLDDLTGLLSHGQRVDLDGASWHSGFHRVGLTGAGCGCRSCRRLSASFLPARISRFIRSLILVMSARWLRRGSRPAPKAGYTARMPTRQAPERRRMPR
jgi:hypothetical protein